jgi:hypothetical protein
VKGGETAGGLAWTAQPLLLHFRLSVIRRRWYSRQSLQTQPARYAALVAMLEVVSARWRHGARAVTLLTKAKLLIRLSVGAGSNPSQELIPGVFVEGVNALKPDPKCSKASVYQLLVVRHRSAKDFAPGVLTSSPCQLHIGGNHG